MKAGVDLGFKETNPVVNSRQFLLPRSVNTANARMLATEECTFFLLLFGQRCSPIQRIEEPFPGMQEVQLGTPWPRDTGEV